MLSIISIMCYAKKDVVKFLGIPVTGTKIEMIKKLKDKCFKYNYEYDYLEGKFNGNEVLIGIETNKGKVYRIAVMSKFFTTETDIKIKFNTLLNQFEKNKKYYSPLKNSKISNKEDISYEMIVKNKRYEAIFYQIGPLKEMRKSLLTKYTEKEIETSNKKLQEEISKYIFEIVSKKTVWFKIDESYGRYGITIFYDNIYNQANGEDL